MRLEWDKSGERFYETGVDHVVLYLQKTGGKYPKGVPWNGITAITEKPGGAESSDMWADNIKYASLRSAETFGATIEAYMFPDEFYECDGSAQLAEGVYLGQQSRSPFGLSYRTKVGNDTATESDDGYKLHIVYGATASPSEKGYSTINDSPEAITLSWEMETTPVNVPGFKATSTITINSLKVEPEIMRKLEDALYGTDETEAHLPLPDEIIEILNSGSGPEPMPEVKINLTGLQGNMGLGSKTAEEIQENIVIDNDSHSISGTLKKVDEPWKEFSNTNNTGYFLGLDVQNIGTESGKDIYFTLEGGSTPEKQVQEDHRIVLKISDEKSQKVKIRVDQDTTTYDLTNLTLQGKEN